MQTSEFPVIMTLATRNGANFSSKSRSEKKFNYHSQGNFPRLMVFGREQGDRYTDVQFNKSPELQKFFRIHVTLGEQSW